MSLMNQSRPWDAPGIRALAQQLQTGADLPEIRDRIRQEILKGTIRVTPGTGGGLRIFPTGLLGPQGPAQLEPLPPT